MPFKYDDQITMIMVNKDGLIQRGWAESHGTPNVIDQLTNYDYNRQVYYINLGGNYSFFWTSVGITSGYRGVCSIESFYDHNS